MMKSPLLGISASISVCMALVAGCSASVNPPSHDALEGQPDAGPTVLVSNGVGPEVAGITPSNLRAYCFQSDCNSACAAETGSPGNSGGMCEGRFCVCCSNELYPATVSADLFNLLVAPQLNGIEVTVANNSLTVTLPSQLGGGTTTSQINAGAAVASLDIPSLQSTSGWQWSMSADSNLITITSSLDATISGSWSGVCIYGHCVGSCGVTALITNAPVTITLQNNVKNTLLGPENYLSVQSVNIPLSKNNTETNGCSLVPADDIRGQFQSQLESNLQSQLNELKVMSTTMDNIVQTIANADAAALNLPGILSPGMSWSCGGWQRSALGTGAINGECQEHCN